MVEAVIACDHFTAHPSIKDTSETGHLKPIRWRLHFMDLSFEVRGEKAAASRSELAERQRTSASASGFLT